MGDCVNPAESFATRLRSAPRILGLYERGGINYSHPMDYPKKGRNEGCEITNAKLKRGNPPGK